MIIQTIPFSPELCLSRYFIKAAGNGTETCWIGRAMWTKREFKTRATWGLGLRNCWAMKAGRERKRRKVFPGLVKIQLQLHWHWQFPRVAGCAIHRRKGIIGEDIWVYYCTSATWNCLKWYPCDLHSWKIAMMTLVTKEAEPQLLNQQSRWFKVSNWFATADHTG